MKTLLDQLQHSTKELKALGIISKSTTFGLDNEKMSDEQLEELLLWFKDGGKFRTVCYDKNPKATESVMHYVSLVKDDVNMGVGYFRVPAKRAKRNRGDFWSWAGSVLAHDIDQKLIKEGHEKRKYIYRDSTLLRRAMEVMGTVPEMPLGVPPLTLPVQGEA